jgi:hypothetical protein
MESRADSLLWFILFNAGLGYADGGAASEENLDGGEPLECWP